MNLLEIQILILIIGILYDQYFFEVITAWDQESFDQLLINPANN